MQYVWGGEKIHTKLLPGSLSLSEDLRVYGRMLLKCISTKKTRSGVKLGMDPSGSG
jgi:hypothetical protein